MQSRDPIVMPIAILDLRPTQITVGMREVAMKQCEWRKQGERSAEFLGRHMIPVVIGPKKRPYIVDHHHLVLALHQESVAHVLTTTVSDISHLEKDAFWVVLDNRGWMHPFDDDGRRRAYGDIPVAITGLIDDPYRSLAGALRRAGGYAKDTTPFSEFLWADFMRRRIKRSVVERDFQRSLKTALAAAKTPEARYLPGWCGPLGEG